MKKMITLIVGKQEMLDEVGKTTAYEGAKSSTADEDVYGKIATTRADAEMLERFWAEACAEVVGAVAEYACGAAEGDAAAQPLRTGEGSEVGQMGTDMGTEVGQMGTGADGLVLRLWMPELFNYAMTGAALQGLRSYVVNYIVSKWMALSNNERAEGYAKVALGALRSMKAALDERVRPSRPGRGGCHECCCEG